MREKRCENYSRDPSVASASPRASSYRLRHLEAAILVLLAASCADPKGYDALEARRQGNTVRSTFRGDAEGWRVTDQSRRVSQIPSLRSSGGTEDHYLEAADYWEKGEWYWRAPAAFHGNLCAYYGGSLDFQIRHEGAGPSMDGGKLILEGRSSRLVFKLPRPPGAEWTKFEVPLEPDPGWQGEPSDSEIKTTLANVTGLLIQGNYGSGREHSGLDSVSLTEPSGIAGLFSWTAECDEQEVKKSVQLVSVEEPYGQLDKFEMGMSFRVEVRFENPPATVTEPVTITNRTTGAEYRFEAVVTNDPTVYRTPPISTLLAHDGGES